MVESRRLSESKGISSILRQIGIRVIALSARLTSATSIGSPSHGGIRFFQVMTIRRHLEEPPVGGGSVLKSEPYPAFHRR